MLQLNTPGRLGLISLGLAVLAACNPAADVGPTSQYALDRSVEMSDNALVGAWYGELNGNEAYVHVVESPRTGSALQTLIVGQQDRRGNSDGWGEALAIPARIGAQGYLSVKLDKFKGEASNETDYLIVRYHTRDRRHVSLYAMDPDRVADAIKGGRISGTSRDRIDSSPDELVKFIENAGGEDLFSVQIGYLERVSENDIPTVQR